MRSVRIWPSLLIAALGILAAAAGARVALRDQRDTVLRTTAAVAAESRAVIRDALLDERGALLSTAAAWQRFGRDPLSEWHFETTILIAILPGVERILWLDRGSGEYRVARREPSALAWDEDAALRSLLEEARAHGEGVALTGPHEGEDGKARLHLLSSSGPDGAVASSLSVPDAIEEALGDSAPGHAIAVYWGEREIFRRGEPAHGYDWWHAEGDIEIAPGVVWRVVHRPTPEHAAAEVSPTPLAILAAGSLIALLLAVLVHQVRRGGDLVRFLDATNVRLDERVREAAEKDRQLRQLNRSLERRIADRTAELDEAVQELEAFNYSVSHDLRSPIGAIVNFSAILEEDYREALGDEGTALVERIQGSAGSALSLLEGLLQLSRVSQEELDRRVVDVEAMVGDCFAEALAAEARGGEVEFVAEALPPALADPRLLRRVFGNLIDNALKYTRIREKRRIWVTGSVVDGECVYCVADNGIGFDVRFAEKLFGVFERLHSADDYEGSGVGLAIVARIVRRHGGRVWAEGELNGGARFFVALPEEGA